MLHCRNFPEKLVSARKRSRELISEELAGTNANTDFVSIKVKHPTWTFMIVYYAQPEGKDKHLDHEV